MVPFSCGNKVRSQSRCCSVGFFKTGIVWFGHPTGFRGVGTVARKYQKILTALPNRCWAKFPNTCFVWPHSATIHMTPICPVNLISLLLSLILRFSPTLLYKVNTTPWGQSAFWLRKPNQPQSDRGYNRDQTILPGYRITHLFPGLPLQHQFSWVSSWMKFSEFQTTAKFCHLLLSLLGEKNMHSQDICKPRNIQPYLRSQHEHFI